MQIPGKCINKFLAGLMVVMFSGAANASLIFDFICDDPTCGGDPIRGGSYEFTEASVLSGTAAGGAQPGAPSPGGPAYRLHA